MFLSQVPILTWVLLQRTQLESIWASLIVGIVSTTVVTLFLYWCSQKQTLKSKIETLYY